VAAFDNDPIVFPLPLFAASPLETQPLEAGTGGPAPTISNEIPVPDTATAPPLTLIQFLVN